jgi:hypothetical protein
MEYASRLRFLGLPLLHVAIGRSREGRSMRGVAKGWIAVGDVAYGVLLALGGVAVGGVAVGGLGLGVLGLGGLAFGIWAAGGLAAGVHAAAGAAFGIVGAMGGLAVAGSFAWGGAAYAPLANTPEVEAILQGRLFYRISLGSLGFLRYGIFLAALPALLAWREKRKQGSTR